MNFHKPKTIPLKTPYRVTVLKSRAAQGELINFITQSDTGILFKPKEKPSNDSIFKGPQGLFPKPDNLTLPKIRKPSNSLSPNLKTSKNYSSKILPPFIELKPPERSNNHLTLRDRPLINGTPTLEISKSVMSLTSRSCSSLIACANNQPVKEMSLVNSPVNGSAMQGILNVFDKPLPSLHYLNLENTGISDKEVKVLCETLSNDRTLQFLGLARNNLTHLTGMYLKHLLIENYYLQKLDLHWNSLSSQGALEVFEGLCSNASLKELDLSWNSIGRCKDLKIMSEIAGTFKDFEGLAHLDLSFNYLNSAECEILSKGLEDNYEILGIHIIGNEATTNSQGFILPQTGCIELKDSHLFTRIFQETRKFKKPVSSHCWLCEKWTEHVFSFSFEEFRKDLEAFRNIFIHFEADEYEAEVLNKVDGKFKLARVLPAGKQKFFFSVSGESFVSFELETEVLDSPINLKVQYTQLEKIKVKAGIVNVIDISGPPCDYKHPFATLPRKPRFGCQRLSVHQIKQFWTADKSMFKDFRNNSRDFYLSCLNFDWAESRLSSFLKSSQEQQSLKNLLVKTYPSLIETFKFLSVQSGNEYPSIGSNVFIDFLNQGQFFDQNYNLSDLGVNWNSVIVPKKKQPYNPGNALVRYEFVEILVRVAFDRYLRNRVCKNTVEAFQFFLQENLEKLIQVNSSEQWRQKHLYEENVDIVLRAFKFVFEVTFKNYSGKKALPGQKAFMSLEEFKAFCYESKIIEASVPARDLEGCFYLAMNLQVDELYEKKHVEMTYLEFLEAFCRAVAISSVGEGKSFRGKLFLAAKFLVLVCPKNVQDNFVVPSKSLLNSMRVNPKKNGTFALK